MLADGLRNHRGPLSASLLATYQLRLADWSGGPLELAELTAALPLGCAFWRSTGGPLAWSQEAHMLNDIRFLLRVAVWQQTKDAEHGRNRPEPTPYPAWKFEQEVKESRAERKLKAWLRRSGSHPTQTSEAAPPAS